MDIENLSQPFNLVVAKTLLAEGFIVSPYGDVDEYFYFEEDNYFNELGERTTWEYIRGTYGTYDFVLVYEDGSKWDESVEKSVIAEEENDTELTEMQFSKSNENITSEIKKNVTAKELKEEELTQKKLGSMQENTTEIIEKKSVNKSVSEKENTTPSTGYMNSSIELKEEKLSSVKLLNNSANQLTKLAKSLTTSKSVDGQEIVPSVDNISVAVKCLTEARNAMKTKLEFIKEME